MPKALDIIRNEHRSICVVLDNLLSLVRGIAERGSMINTGVFDAMVNYLETYAERVHHPKEDQYLFEAVRRHDAQAEALIAGLEREHADGERALRDLKNSLTRYEKVGRQGFPAFEKVVEDYVRVYLDHMRKEEEQVFPLAQKLLKPEDWAAIDAAFEKSRDPLAAGRDGGAQMPSQMES